MKLYSFLKKSSPHFGLKLFLFGMAAGLMSTLLLVIINYMIKTDPNNSTYNARFALYYLVIMIAFFGIQSGYQSMLIRMAQKLIWRLRITVLNDIRKSDFEGFQKLGHEQIYTVLTTDTENISFISNVLATVVTSSVTIICSLIYLAWLVPIGFCITLLLIVLVMSVYLVRQKRIMADLHAARNKETEFFKYIHHLVFGIKEVKMDAAVSDDLYHNYLQTVATDAQYHKTKSNIAFMNNGLLGQIFFFVVLGCFLFVLPAFKIHLLDNTAQYILITMYIMAPAQTIAQLMPYFSFAQIGIDRFEKLQNQLAGATDLEQQKEDLAANFTHLKLKDITFTYALSEQNENHPFHIGPINFSIQPGEVVFVSGANGSGKSTFVKLLTGLFYPKSGDVCVGETTLRPEHFQSYRELFQCIFADNYLWDTLYGNETITDKEINQYLKEYEIDHLTEIQSGKIRNIELSDGQKKRIALAIAMVSKKPVMVFDEIAANQDPQFREYFYTQILGILKKQHKAVIVITHDEHYFKHADRHLKMENGVLQNYIN